MKHVWRKGPPPSIGWWPASANEQPDSNSIRWWDGEHWSLSAWPVFTSEQAFAKSKIKSFSRNDEIKWTDRWWL